MHPSARARARIYLANRLCRVLRPYLIQPLVTYIAYSVQLKYNSFPRAPLRARARIRLDNGLCRVLRPYLIQPLVTYIAYSVQLKYNSFPHAPLRARARASTLTMDFVVFCARI